MLRQQSAPEHYRKLRNTSKCNTYCRKTAICNYAYFDEGGYNADEIYEGHAFTCNISHGAEIDTK